MNHGVLDRALRMKAACRLDWYCDRMGCGGDHQLWYRLMYTGQPPMHVWDLTGTRPAPQVCCPGFIIQLTNPSWVNIIVLFLIIS